MKKIKFAVIDAGHIGKRHAEMVRRNPDAELVAVADILPKEKTGFEGDVPYFASIDEFLAAEVNADVVNICTPNGYHADYAVRCLSARYHVVIEKPIALTKADAERVLYKSLEMSRHVFCVMQNRYSPLPNGSRASSINACSVISTWCNSIATGTATTATINQATGMERQTSTVVHSLRSSLTL